MCCVSQKRIIKMESLWNVFLEFLERTIHDKDSFEYNDSPDGSVGVHNQVYFI